THVAGLGLGRVRRLHDLTCFLPGDGTSLAGGIPRLVCAVLYRTVMAGAAGEPGRRRTAHRPIEPAVSRAAEIALGESTGGAVDRPGDDLGLQRGCGT